MPNTNRAVRTLARFWRAVDRGRVGEQGRAGEAADAVRSDAMAGAGLLVLAANLTVGVVLSTAVGVASIKAGRLPVAGLGVASLQGLGIILRAYGTAWKRPSRTAAGHLIATTGTGLGIALL